MAYDFHIITEEVLTTQNWVTVAHPSAYLLGLHFKMQTVTLIHQLVFAYHRVTVTVTHPNNWLF